VVGQVVSVAVEDRHQHRIWPNIAAAAIQKAVYHGRDGDVFYARVGVIVEQHVAVIVSR
jgi:hypothetical protein